MPVFAVGAVLVFIEQPQLRAELLSTLGQVVLHIIGWLIAIPVMVALVCWFWHIGLIIDGFFITLALSAYGKFTNRHHK